ncbi:MAG: sulfotransferase [Acidobacteriaceae bacterium]|nr:sulfotransferase [Acidobacteriaceae bacterium]
MVHWTELGGKRLLQPFFEQDLQGHMQQPFHQLFRRETGIEELLEWGEQSASLPLRGVILHMSRCGSTLISQMLAAVPHYVVASEPSPLDQVLRSQVHAPGLSREMLVRWTRAMVVALAQPRAGGEDGFFVKLDCWHLHQVDLLREAFPDVPFVFLYREPLEVMASHARIPAAWTVPGLLHPLILGLQQEDWQPQALEVYCARALQNICEAGVVAAERYGALLLNFTELPAAMFGRVARHFDLRLEDFPAMLEQSRRNAKEPMMPFVSDSSEKRASASLQVKAATETYLRDVYERLEAARLA